MKEKHKTFVWAFLISVIIGIPFWIYYYYMVYIEMENWGSTGTELFRLLTPIFVIAYFVAIPFCLDMIIKFLIKVTKKSN